MLRLDSKWLLFIQIKSALKGWLLKDLQMKAGRREGRGGLEALVGWGSVTNLSPTCPPQGPSCLWFPFPYSTPIKSHKNHSEHFRGSLLLTVNTSHSWELRSTLRHVSEEQAPRFIREGTKAQRDYRITPWGRETVQSSNISSKDHKQLPYSRLKCPRLPTSQLRVTSSQRGHCAQLKQHLLRGVEGPRLWGQLLPGECVWSSVPWSERRQIQTK